MKRLGPTLLLLLFVATLTLIFFIMRKDETIDAQEAEIARLEYNKMLEQEIIDGDDQILYLRARKKVNCEILGTGMSVALLDSCGFPGK